MSEDPSKNETDTLGRPRGYDRVHAVDTSVLPSIPATPVTGITMANALRISSHYGEA